jgi:chromosome segregation ATPase
MIEETAGTAIYNKTKNESERMIKNKEAKLESINEILKASIIPQMEKLKVDRKRYTAFKEKENELKKLNEDVKTYEFVTKRNLISKCEFEVYHIREQLTNKKTVMQETTERLTEL